MSHFMTCYSFNQHLSCSSETVRAEQLKLPHSECHMLCESLNFYDQIIKLNANTGRKLGHCFY